jgi:hypothetical protein
MSLQSFGDQRGRLFLLRGDKTIEVLEYDRDDPAAHVDALQKWAHGFGLESRLVHQSHLYFKTVFISTVFLGLDHSFSASGGPPILWETLMDDEAGGIPYDVVDRCAGGWSDAVNMHNAWYNKVLANVSVYYYAITHY